MPRIDPLPREDLAELNEALQFVEASMGFVPNSMPTMARVPGLLEGFLALGRGALGNDLLPNDLKQLIALVTSMSGGCRYCQAHTGHSAERLGVSAEKLDAVWTFESSDLFTEAEKAALSLAFAAGQVPNGTTDDHLTRLKQHWSDEQITAVVAVIAMFGFLNRWNDTMATQLEEDATHFGETHLASHGWELGKHG